MEYLSLEERLICEKDQLAIEQEMRDLELTISLSMESASMLQTSLSIAEEARDHGDVTARDAVNLNNSINSVCVSVGLESADLEIAVEGINDPVTSLTLSIEEGHSILTKILNGIKKTYARYQNILGKYVGKLDTLLSSIFTNLDKRKSELISLNSEGKKLSDATIADDSFFKWNGLALMAAVGIGKMKDPVVGLNEMIDNYGKPGYIKDFADKIISMVRDDKKLTPIYNNPEAMKAVERNLGKKILNFFCKSTVDDRMIIGGTYNNVFILERCKMLHITWKGNPWNYHIIASTLPTLDQFGTPRSFDTPKYKDLLDLIEKGMKITKDRNKVVNEIHDMIKIGSKTIADIDDAADFENTNIYGVLPQILLVLSKTYAEIPNMVDGLASIYIKELKNS